MMQTDISIVCHHEKLTSYCFWTRYHVPRSWFKQSGNVLVIFEEKGGDPSKIEFSRRKITGVCALVAENYPSIDLESWNEGSGSNKTVATVHLGCPEDTHISSVKFASFGNPTGGCGSYTQGNCHDPNSISVVEKVSTSNSPLCEFNWNYRCVQLSICCHCWGECPIPVSLSACLLTFLQTIFNSKLVSKFDYILIAYNLEVFDS